MKIIVTSFILCAVFFFISCSADTRPDLFAIPYHPELDITHRAQQILVGPLAVHVDVSRPIKPFQHQSFQLTFYQGAAAVEVRDPRLTFNMKMDMGRLIYLPVVSGRHYVSDVQIPKCLTGDIRWYGKLAFEYKGHAYTGVFLFDAQ